MDKTLEHHYYDLSAPSAYAGGHQLVRAVAASKRNDTDNIAKWLEGQDAYTLHKLVRYRFPRRNYNVFSPYEVWEADLIDFRSLKTYNDKYNYVLVVIDVLSKYAWAVPLYDKSGKSVAEALENILTSCRGRHPIYLQTDKGKEFVAREVQQVLKQRNITYRVARDPDIKAAVAERFIRTLKARIWRYFTHTHTRRYIDVLNKIVSCYNNSWHSGIKMAPSKVNLENADEARRNLTLRYSNKQVLRKPKYSVGDLVRVSRARTAFRKAYEGGWTLELFKIVRINSTRPPPVYILEDLDGEKIDGYFYEEQLSRVRKELGSDVFEIGEILETKGRGRGKRYFVSWKGYPEKFNSWISARDLKNLK